MGQAEDRAPEKHRFHADIPAELFQRMRRYRFEREKTFTQQVVAAVGEWLDRQGY